MDGVALVVLDRNCHGNCHGNCVGIVMGIVIGVNFFHPYLPCDLAGNPGVVAGTTEDLDPGVPERLHDCDERSE